jgi:hypothetical protein
VIPACRQAGRWHPFLSFCPLGGLLMGKTSKKINLPAGRQGRKDDTILRACPLNGKQLGKPVKLWNAQKNYKLNFSKKL